MKWLIWSIRTWFCKHEWEYSEQWKEKYDPIWKFTERSLKEAATCRKCGWHRKYNKF